MRNVQNRFLARVTTLLAVAVMSAPQAQAGERESFKVCADPNYPPFSTRSEEGIENRLAQILAADLGLPVAYTWFPARIGFVRNTLRAEDPGGNGYKCDVVMNVPEDYELTITTRPYFTSAYSLLYVKGRKLDMVKRQQDFVALPDEIKNGLKVGITERGPGAMWLAKYEMYDQMHAYQAQTGSLDYYPGRAITEDLLAGRIDAAVLWGPIAGRAKRLAREQDQEIELIPLMHEPGVRFHYSISLGTRHPDDDWRDQLDALLQKNRDKIRALLREFEVPLVSPDGKSLEP